MDFIHNINQIYGETFLKKHKQILKSYNRNHQGTNFGDVEKGKINREKHQIIKLQTKSKTLIYKTIANSDDNLLDEIDNINHQYKKVTGNLNTHKIRLTELQKNNDFN